MNKALTKFIDSLTFGNVKEIHKYPKGQINDDYFIKTNQGDYSLKIYSNKKPSEILFEVNLLNYLKGLPVPKLVKLDKEYLTKFANRYAILYKYIPGRHLKNFTGKQTHEVGQFIAKFHLKGKGFRHPKPREKTYWLPDSKIRRYENFIRKSNLKYKSIIPQIVKDLKKNRLSLSLSQGPIHVDIKPENLLFSKGKLTGVLDFDNSYIGPLLLDLAKSMVWFGLANKKFNLKPARDIYKGYISKRKLNKKEYKELYKAVKFAFLSHIFVDYYRRGQGLLTQKYFKFMARDFYQSHLSFNLNKKSFYRLINK